VNPANTPPDFSEMDDEDQLAYLRAQAAQDAAIAGLGSNGSANGNGTQRNQRGQNFRNQNNQGNPRNGRNQNQNRNRNRNQNQNQGQNQNPANRGARFRPQAGNFNAQSMEARPRTPEASPEVLVPDYEVLNRSGDGSES